MLKPLPSWRFRTGPLECSLTTAKESTNIWRICAPAAYGIGIIGIKQRVEELGGPLVYRNTNPGTAVEVNIPVKSAKGKAEAVTVRK